MVSVVVRGIPEETHAALKARARRHKRSTEAEIRQILTDAVAPVPERGLGTLLQRIGREVGGAEIVSARDHAPYEPLDLL
ncbi:MULTISPECIES: Arc family DNA-binding protein [unclassified Actinomyces]|uniref:FitA-like ribbon-helix-helix domain-containing protein n=1 Tax=unclassified Actinomyces TaxID=2609248 RepID=UPI002017809C|nr:MULTISPECIES: Arc family DNA-binding protein [unclassified Actinomyces]MCL3778019.1 Arc family DNA-binding protein [Actinomyces sp. AC-20-1]MCL3789982.1 Arc family DNA-binding protein [Actinomyces sp. 187325]MCL3791540.1 Arc family DNA-binding protein [Actinomyces sp. 186855]MCL3793807.1 Arc family DNA-binding protein [Actinomyces sp. 217892]